VKCRSMELMVENDDSKEERVNNHKKKRVTSMHLKN
jgi:ATP-dependent RNA helicase DDX24/MAK5